MRRQCHTLNRVLIVLVYKNEIMAGLTKLMEPDHIIKYPASSLRLAPHNVLHSLVIVYCIIINPRRMREGYGSRSVCLSVTELAATYLDYTLKFGCH